MAQLKIWSKQKFGDRKKKLKQLKNKLSDLRHNYKQYDEENVIKSIEMQIDNLLLDKIY